MAGLNDGFELDDNEDGETTLTEVLFKNPVPGTVPELDENTLIINTSDIYDDVTDLKSDIVQSGGMSKYFALEAEKFISNFISEDRPIGYFTERPSKTLYKVCLEEIDNTKKELYIKIVQSILDTLSKFKQWQESITPVFNKYKEYYKINSNETQSVKALQIKKICECLSDTDGCVDRLKMFASEDDKLVVDNYLTNVKKSLDDILKYRDDFYSKCDSSVMVRLFVTDVQMSSRIIITTTHIGAFVEIISSIANNQKEIIDNPSSVIDDKSLFIKLAQSANTLTGSTSFVDFINKIKIFISRNDVSENRESVVNNDHTSEKSLDDLFNYVRSFGSNNDISRAFDSLQSSLEVFDTAQKSYASIVQTVESNTPTDEVFNRIKDDTKDSVNELYACLYILKYFLKIVESYYYVGGEIENIYAMFIKAIKTGSDELGEDSFKKISEYFGFDFSKDTTEDASKDAEPAGDVNQSA